MNIDDAYDEYGIQTDVKEKQPLEAVETNSNESIDATSKTDGGIFNTLVTIDPENAIMGHFQIMENLVRAWDLRDLFDDLRFQRTEPVLFWG
jgi:hypothetical protein